MLLAKPTARRRFAAIALDQASFDRSEAPAGLHTDAKESKWTNL